MQLTLIDNKSELVEIIAWPIRRQAIILIWY